MLVAICSHFRSSALLSDSPTLSWFTILLLGWGCVFNPLLQFRARRKVSHLFSFVFECSDPSSLDVMYALDDHYGRGWRNSYSMLSYEISSVLQLSIYLLVSFPFSVVCLVMFGWEMACGVLIVLVPCPSC